MALLAQQLEEFAAFAKRLEEERGGELSLDDAMREWQQIDHAEIAILQERIASYQAGERGRPVDEFLAERRAARAKRNS